MKLSIIIPAYNAFNTINKTLESIAVQKTDYNFEVIIVNDCSNGSYDQFIDKYLKIFNVKEIKLDVNVGPGTARKIGLENANGEYITFIDSDDYFYSPYSLNDMLEEIIKEDADLLISNFIYERDNKKIVKSKNHVWLHGKVYKNKFLKDNKITFNDARANEDNGFNRLILLSNAKVIYLDQVTYVYQENSSSITRRDNRLYKYTSLEWFCYNMKWAMDNSNNEEGKRYLALSVLVAMYLYYLDLSEEYDVNNLLKWSADIYFEYYKNNKYTYQEIKDSIDINSKECLTKDVELFITFEEFIKRIEECND